MNISRRFYFVSLSVECVCAIYEQPQIWLTSSNAKWLLQWEKRFAWLNNRLSPHKTCVYIFFGFAFCSSRAVKSRSHFIYCTGIKCIELMNDSLFISLRCSFVALCFEITAFRINKRTNTITTVSGAYMQRRRMGLHFYLFSLARIIMNVCVSICEHINVYVCVSFALLCSIPTVAKRSCPIINQNRTAAAAYTLAPCACI